MRRIDSLSSIALGLALALAVFAHPAAARTALDTLLITPEISINPALPTSSDSVRLKLEYCDPCGYVTSIERLNDSFVVVHIEQADSTAADSCGRHCPFPLAGITLGPYAPGLHIIIVDTYAHVAGTDSLTSTIHSRVHLYFDVTDSSSTPPPPPPLPYIKQILIGSEVPCDPTPVACPYDSIPVTLRGSFPDDCYRIRRIDLLEPIFARYPGPHPPIVRVLVDDMGCLGRVCVRGDFPFEAKVNLPGLPPNVYGLNVVVGTSTCSDVFPNDTTVHSTIVPFTVVEQCSTRASQCVLPFWLHPNLNGCDDVVRSDHPAHLVFEVRSNVALSGLQGNLELRSLDRSVGGGWLPGFSTALAITGIEPIGVAAGMHVQWSPVEDGARFLMFADAGAPIPALALDDTTAVPILRVIVASLDTGIVAAVSGLRAFDLLGSDENGGAVRECDLPCVRRDPFAYICNGSQGCDVNHDGAFDVRDLVTMIHCVMHTGSCLDSAASSFDCNSNGSVDLNDVLCCGSVILLGHMPDSTAARPEHGIIGEFGDAVRTGNGVDVPLALTGNELFGAARLALSFPTDRFDVTGVEITGTDRSWLELHQRDGDQLVLGLIRIPGPRPALVTDGRVHLLIHFALRSGSQAGGMVTVTGGDFSDLVGAALAVDLGAPSQMLGEPPIGLSSMQPNPFGRETRFAVHLARAAEVELAVHDLVGRRVATLHRGTLPAGTRVFSWDGRDAAGGRAANGVYFVRLVTDGRVTARKVILVRAP
jgi:hypothetical protein